MRAVLVHSAWLDVFRQRGESALDFEMRLEDIPATPTEM